MLNETSQAQKDNYYMIPFISLNLIKVEIRMERLERRGSNIGDREMAAIGD